jgi:hypothetical protein
VTLTASCAEVGSGLAGRAALSPLIAGATTELVERAAQEVLAGTEPGKAQAESLVKADRFERLIGMERLMSSSLMEYLYKDQLAATAQVWAAEQERGTAALALAIEGTLAARFPQTPIASVGPVRRVRDLVRLQEVLRAVLEANDQAAAEEALRAAYSPR